MRLYNKNAYRGYEKEERNFGDELQETKKKQKKKIIRGQKKDQHM
jgi:hypothetical protein